LNRSATAANIRCASAQGANMDETAIASSRRTDDQLLFMMDQTAEWTVNGRAGAVLALFGSLRDALTAVFRFEADGVHVFAVCRHPHEEVVVFREQVGRVADSDGRIERIVQHTKTTWPAAAHADRPRAAI
jgi:hypothetical protein